MTKKTDKPTEEQRAALERRMDALCGQGLENMSVTARNFWQDGKDGYDPFCDDRWLNALEQVDMHSNAEPMRILFKEGHSISPFINRMLADWLARQERKGKRGRPRTAAYDLSIAIARLELARLDVREQCAKSIARAVAIHTAARAHGVSEEALANFCDGKLGSARRMAKRR